MTLRANMDDEAIIRKIDRMSRQIDTEVAAIAIDDQLSAAVRNLDAEESLLKQRYSNCEVSKDEYFALWHELMDRTPHEVIVASIKLTQAISAALSKPDGATEA
jgi:hypothetical protein